VAEQLNGSSWVLIWGLPTCHTEQLLCIRWDLDLSMVRETSHKKRSENSNLHQ